MKLLSNRKFSFTQFSQILRVLFLLFLLQGCESKKGCIDPFAVNYVPNAQIDDGGCEYFSSNKTAVRLSKLENLFEENSGLAFDGQRLWTMMDGGGQNKVYSINFSTGNLLEEITLLGIENIDFEAISHHKGEIYVGDFGNNDGEREDLVVHKFSVPQPLAKTNSVNSEAIYFNYSDQTDFQKNEFTAFDAEAMIVFKDKICVFTKNHIDNSTALYEFPAIPIQGKHQATKSGVFNSQGLITDAAISKDGSKVALVGHDGENAFVWLFSDFNDHIFSGKKIKINLGTVQEVGQVEGISFFNDKNLFISNEKNHGVNPRIYLIDISNLHE